MEKALEAGKAGTGDVSRQKWPPQMFFWASPACAERTLETFSGPGAEAPGPPVSGTRVHGMHSLGIVWRDSEHVQLLKHRDV
jgi:hypothetical protein